MTFGENLRVALSPNEQLPRQLHLGHMACSWANGKFKVKGVQFGFKELTPDELRQLKPRLLAAPQDHVIYLHLEFHHMGGELMREMVGPIAALRSLQVLVLDSNDIGDIGSSAIAEVLPQLTALHLLSLGDNGIGVSGCSSLAKTLPHLSCLQVLTLGWNCIGAAGCCALAEALPHLSALQELYLDKNDIGPPGCCALAQALPRLSDLQVLSLQSNNIGTSGSAALAQALLPLSVLREVHLGWNGVGNCTDVASVCSIVPSLLNKPRLSEVGLDHLPSSCVGTDAWLQSGLAVPPDEVIREGWKAVLQFLSAGPTLSVHGLRLRLMLIGDGEVGKTSLQRAFVAQGNKADRIGKRERTVGIDISELSFSCAGKPTIKCQVCDFAGQEIYYFSHTMHFTRRCLYVLMWTAHKFSESGDALELSLLDIMFPLKQWLQLLAANVPEASVILVGTHSLVQPETFNAMRSQVEQQVLTEMQRLRFVAVAESKATREVFRQQQSSADALLNQIISELPTGSLQFAAPRLDVTSIRAFLKRLNEARPFPKRGVMQKAKLLLKTVQELTRTQERLCRLHAVYDGSFPEADAPLAQLKLVNAQSFAVDSIEGVGVAELLAAIEATCRDTQALPFMGEAVPQSWLQVSDALKQAQQRKQRLQLLQPGHTVHDDIGDSVMSVDEAVCKVHELLQSKFEVEVGLARCLDSRGLQSSLEFWSLMGQVFLHDGHFLRDPRLVIDLLKPLVHHDILDPSLHKDGFRQQCLANPADFSSDNFLKMLQKDAVLDHRLLPHLKAWNSSSTEAHSSMLKFFEDTFMISTIRASLSNQSTGSAGAQRSLVTARLFDCSDVERQREVDDLAHDIAANGIFHAVYTLPSAHVGIIAHMIATVQALQPKKNALSVTFARSHVCIERKLSRCAVSMRSLSDLFASKLGSIQGELLPGRFAHSIVISSNDDGLFAFAARCVDAIMKSGNFGSHYQSWLPYRLSAADGSWRPSKDDWSELSSPDNMTSLSEVLSSNASDVVIPSLNLKLREILPRRPRIFMSHTNCGDGAGECCQRIKKGLEQRLLCTVWFDKAEMGWTDAFIDEMKRGMANSNAFIMCLSPLYLTRPNCLRELMWAMDMCAADKTKKLCVLPMHPCASYAGCRAIVDLAAAGCAAQVILPVDDRCKQVPTQLRQLKAHKLSDAAIQLLQRLIGTENVGINSDWLKLQPWTSDAEGDNWEETSQPWVGPREGDSVELSYLLDSLCMEVQASVQRSCTVYPMSAFANINDRDLQSLPPSQAYLTPPDTALIRSAFPHIVQNFTEPESVRLISLGVRDFDALGCIAHGVKRCSSMHGSQPNPVDQVFRMAAQMSGADFEKAAQIFEAEMRRAEEERQKVDAETKMRLEEERMKIEVEANQRAAERSAVAATVAAAAALRRRCFKIALLAIACLLFLILYRTGCNPRRLRRQLVGLLFWRRWR